MARFHSCCIFLLLVSVSPAFCIDNSGQIDNVLEQLKDIVDHYDKEAYSKKDHPVEDVKKEPIALDDELEFEADVRKLADTTDKPKCTNAIDDKCLKSVDKCFIKSVKMFCPRTCLVCCADYNDQFCKTRKRLCFSKSAKHRMRHYCPKTCEYCGKAPAPPPCLDSKHGCCWDKSTPASAPFGSGRENCPPCKDKRSKQFCNMFIADCTDYHPQHVKGNQIRAFCPKTCRVCGKHPQCFDHPKQQYNCPQFREEGLCKTSEKHMRFWCPKTCGFCKTCNDSPAADCNYLKKHNACTQYRDSMKAVCPYTCNLCP